MVVQAISASCVMIWHKHCVFDRFCHNIWLNLGFQSFYQFYDISYLFSSLIKRSVQSILTSLWTGSVVKPFSAIIFVFICLLQGSLLSTITIESPTSLFHKAKWTATLLRELLLSLQNLCKACGNLVTKRSASQQIGKLGNIPSFWVGDIVDKNIQK